MGAVLNDSRQGPYRSLPLLEVHVNLGQDYVEGIDKLFLQYPKRGATFLGKRRSSGHGSYRKAPKGVPICKQTLMLLQKARD